MEDLEELIDDMLIEINEYQKAKLNKSNKVVQRQVEYKEGTWEEICAKERAIDKAIEQAREEEWDMMYGSASEKAEEYIKEHDTINQQQVEEDESNEGLRRIPVGEFLKLKKDSFLLYMALQQMSYREQGEKERYVLEKSLNFSALRRITGIKHGATMKQKFEQLQIDGFITKTVDNQGVTRYILPLVSDYYVLIDMKIRCIKAVMELCDENLVRVMLFHKSYSESMKRKGQKEYSVTRKVICEAIGLSSKASKNLDIITKCNDALEGLGTINTRRAWEMKDGSTQERIYFSCNI